MTTLLQKITAHETEGSLSDLVYPVREIEKSDLGTLRSLLKEAHGGSHSWTLRDTTPTGIAQAVASIRGLHDKYLPLKAEQMQIPRAVSEATVESDV